MREVTLPKVLAGQAVQVAGVCGTGRGEGRGVVMWRMTVRGERRGALERRSAPGSGGGRGRTMAPTTPKHDHQAATLCDFRTIQDLLHPPVIDWYYTQCTYTLQPT